MGISSNIKFKLTNWDPSTWIEKLFYFIFLIPLLVSKKSLYLWVKNVNKPPLNFFYICIWLFGYKELFNHLKCGSIYKKFRWHQSIWGFSCQSIIFIIAGHKESKSFYWCYICSFFESASLYKAFSILRRSIGYFDWYIPHKILINFLQFFRNNNYLYWVFSTPTHIKIKKILRRTSTDKYLRHYLLKTKISSIGM